MRGPRRTSRAGTFRRRARRRSRRRGTARSRRGPARCRGPCGRLAMAAARRGSGRTCSARDAAGMRPRCSTRTRCARSSGARSAECARGCVSIACGSGAHEWLEMHACVSAGTCCSHANVWVSGLGAASWKSFPLSERLTCSQAHSDQRRQWRTVHGTHGELPAVCVRRFCGVLAPRRRGRAACGRRGGCHCRRAPRRRTRRPCSAGLPRSPSPWRGRSRRRRG